MMDVNTDLDLKFCDEKAFATQVQLETSCLKTLAT